MGRLAAPAEGSRAPRCGPHYKSSGPANRSGRRVGSRLAGPRGIEGAYLPGTSRQASGPRRGGQTGATRACHWTGSAVKAVADLQPLQQPGAGSPTPPHRRPRIDPRATDRQVACQLPRGPGPGRGVLPGADGLPVWLLHLGQPAATPRATGRPRRGRTWLGKRRCAYSAQQLGLADDDRPGPASKGCFDGATIFADATLRR
jgi:hypothetical protein